MVLRFGAPCIRGLAVYTSRYNMPFIVHASIYKPKCSTAAQKQPHTVSTAWTGAYHLLGVVFLMPWYIQIYRMWSWKCYIRLKTWKQCTDIAIPWSRNNFHLCYCVKSTLLPPAPYLIKIRYPCPLKFRKLCCLFSAATVIGTGAIILSVSNAIMGT